MLQDLLNSKSKNDGPNDHEDLKKKREEFSMEIRRDSRQQLFQKKRSNIAMNVDMPISDKGLQSQTNTTVVTPEVNQALKEFIEVCVNRTYTMDDFNNLIESINSEEVKLQLFGVIGLRKVLSIEEGPPIQAVIDANLVPKFIEFMQKKDQPHLQLEAAWALTNVASGTTQQTQTIIDKGGIPLFVELLKSKHYQVAEQAIWALGNIAGDSSIYRDMVIKCGGLEPLIKLIEEAHNKNTVKHGTWALSNLCRGRPLPKFELVFKSIPTFCKVVKEETDPEVLTDATWALSYLSDGSENRIEMVVKTGIIPHLINFLEHPFLSILIPSLRTLGNIVTGNDAQTNEVISCGALERFFQLLGHEKKAVRREACWSLSNITAGTPDQISMIVSQPKYIEKLISLINTDCTEIKREAAWVLSNATNRGHSKDVAKLVQYGVLTTFVQLLDSEDVKTVAVVLEAIKNILKHGQEHFTENGENTFLTLLESIGAVPKLEKLQLHPNDEIYEKSLKILETYFQLEDPI